MPSVAIQTAAPGVIRAACLECGMTTGCMPPARPCCRCGSAQLVSLGPWEPQPGLFTVQLLFERGRLPYEAAAFGNPVPVRL